MDSGVHDAYTDKFYHRVKLVNMKVLINVDIRNVLVIIGDTYYNLLNDILCCNIIDIQVTKL